MSNHYSQDNRDSDKHADAAKRTWGQRLQLAIAPLLVAAYVWLVRKTFRVHKVFGEEHLRSALNHDGAVIPCAWHRRLLISGTYLLEQRRRGFKVGFLISVSRDGELIARVAKWHADAVPRGSSTRTGSRALKETQAAMDQGISPVFFADGPHGPAQVFKHGAAILARNTGAPMLLIGCASPDYWELKTWDRMQVPKPFARYVMAIGELRWVGEHISNEEIDSQTAELGAELRRLTQQAEAELENI